MLVADPAGRVRVESPSAFQGMGLSVIGDIDGERVARWTGAVAIKNGVATQSSPTVRVLPEVSR